MYSFFSILFYSWWNIFTSSRMAIISCTQVFINNIDREPVCFSQQRLGGGSGGVVWRGDGGRRGAKDFQPFVDIVSLFHTTIPYSAVVPPDEGPPMMDYAWWRIAPDWLSLMKDFPGWKTTPDEGLSMFDFHGDGLPLMKLPLMKDYPWSTIPDERLSLIKKDYPWWKTTLDGLRLMRDHPSV